MRPASQRRRYQKAIDRTTKALKVGLPLDGIRAIEREANIFASELLMPEAAVRAAWGEFEAQGVAGDPAAAMAARRDVSPSAMGWQLFNLRPVEEKPE